MIKIDLKQFIYDRHWLGYGRYQIWVNMSPAENIYRGKWQWKWVKQ